MATSNNLGDLLTSVADAIRAKNGTTASINAQAFPSAIMAIPSSGVVLDDITRSLINKTIVSINANNTIVRRALFYSCLTLQTASFPACTRIKTIAFQYCSALTTISFPVCEYIEQDAFAACSKLMAASFPSCSYLESYIFQSCLNLRSASFPICTRIGQYAFSGCRALTDISFPKCTRIESNAFRSCTILQTASFPECTYIGSYAFVSCNRLSYLYLTGSTVCTLASSNAFSSTPIATNIYGGYYGSIYVPASLLATYKTATNWSQFAARFVGI